MQHFGIHHRNLVCPKLHPYEQCFKEVCIYAFSWGEVGGQAIHLLSWKSLYTVMLLYSVFMINIMANFQYIKCCIQMTENKIMLSCEMNDGKPDHCKTNRMICRQYSQVVIIVVLYPKHTLLVGKESVLCHTNTCTTNCKTTAKGYFNLGKNRS